MEPRNPGMSTVPQSTASHAESTPLGVDMDPVEYTLRKRLPRKLPKRRNDVYVNMKTDFRAQLARCQKLLEGGGHREICVHGLGLAINRAINIALQLQASSQGVLQLAANTSTVELVDDLEPDDPDEAREPMTRTRNNSAIHVKVFYPDPQWCGSVGREVLYKNAFCSPIRGREGWRGHHWTMLIHHDAAPPHMIFNLVVHVSCCMP